MRKTVASKRARARKILQALQRAYPDAKIALAFSNPYELLVATILSAQCTDERVNMVTPELFRRYPSARELARANPARLETEIRSTGFYRAKTRNILAAARDIKTRFKGKIPRTMAEMLTIPGIGRKSANVVLGTIYGVHEGIAVDTHVKRLAKQLGFTTHADPLKIERDLMAIIPRKEWTNFNYRLADYGRQYCPARPHDHIAKKCPLAKFYVA